MSKHTCATRSFVPALALILSPVPLVSASAQDAITRTSVDSSGGQGDRNSHTFQQAVSGDGRFVVFDSDATTLVANDTNGERDVFVHDRSSGATVLLSFGPSGAEGNGPSIMPAISKDGRFVAYSSSADNLVANDLNGFSDIFVHDRDPDGNGVFDEGNGVNLLVSVDSAGAQGNGHSAGGPMVSADGSVAAFESDASNLVAGDTNRQMDIFIHDFRTGVTTRVSVGSSGSQGNGRSGNPALSSDGTVVAFESTSSNFVAGDKNDASDIFVRDLNKGTTRCMSLDPNSVPGDLRSSVPAISGDGRFVAFDSWATNLVANDTNGTADIFLRDRQGRVTTRVSVDSNGGEANGGSLEPPSLNGDGSLVAFSSEASNLVADDLDGDTDVFLRDNTTGATTAVSFDCAGNARSGALAAISDDGTVVSFSSYGDQLVAGDTNDAEDVFAFDRSVVGPTASWKNYGAGFPGTLGVPNLMSSAAPVFGTTITLALDNSLGSLTAAFLLVGFNSTSIPLNGSGTVLVDPFAVEVLAVPAGGLFTNEYVARDPALCGVDVYLQAIEFDAGAAKGFSFTPGLDLFVGN